jgi:hypothetical protein
MCLASFEIHTCDCCKVPQAVRMVWTDDRGYVPGLCDTCLAHRGADPTKVLLRAEDHERMLRERCEKAREAATDAEAKMKAAFQSRDYAVRLLRQLDGIHEPLGLRACGCGVRGACRTREVLDRVWVRDRVADLERRDREEEMRDAGYFVPRRPRSAAGPSGFRPPTTPRGGSTPRR